MNQPHITQSGFVIMRIRNIRADTSPQDLAELFAAQQLYVDEVRIDMLCPDKMSSVEAFVTIARAQVEQAYRGASMFSWRDQDWDVALPWEANDAGNMDAWEGDSDY